MPRRERHAPLLAVRACRSTTVQPLVFRSHAMNAPTASGSDASTAFADTFDWPRSSLRPYGVGHRQRDDRRLRRVSGGRSSASGT